MIVAERMPEPEALNLPHSRLTRFRRMTWGQIASKCKAKAYRILSPNRSLRRLAYALDKLSLRNEPPCYEERTEYGPSNLAVKLRRVAAGGPFEPLDVALVNKVALKLVGNVRSVLEVGSGTAMFASALAARRPDVYIKASEFDDATREWAQSNRGAANITFCRNSLSDFSNDEFDLAVALEVVEHIGDYASFLHGMSLVAPIAIISTPNKSRSAFDSVATTPTFGEHVREWNAGEFYWVLRVFWNNVELFTIPKIERQVKRLAEDTNYEPTYSNAGLHCREHSLIAVCSNPSRVFTG
jgi:2-polyprenyl-3-methyl-5-hydroxy-6-metoxy-1,4-benzoquinol methylase